MLRSFVFKLDKCSPGMFDMSLRSLWQNFSNSVSISFLFNLDSMCWSNPCESAISSLYDNTYDEKL